MNTAMKRSRRLAVFVAVFLAALAPRQMLGAHAPAAVSEPGPTILIQNATILTVSHGNIERGAILIRDGKIAEVGASVKAPKDAQVIDAAGQVVLPGII